jgi:hypothetical protein
VKFKNENQTGSAAREIFNDSRRRTSPPREQAQLAPRWLPRYFSRERIAVAPNLA